MSQSTKYSQRISLNGQGFTLLELIIAIAIIGSLSVVSLQSLWDTLSSRSKQYSLENSSSALRNVINTLTEAIVTGNQVNVVSSSVIKITGTTCRTIQYDNSTKSLVQATSDVPTCTPPTTGFVPLTPVNITITSFTFAPVGPFPNFVTIVITGFTQDSLGKHDFNYTTTVTPRITI